MPRRGGISENRCTISTWPQSAMLAGLIRAPSALAPSRNLKAAQRRGARRAPGDVRQRRDRSDAVRRGARRTGPARGRARTGARPELLSRHRRRRGEAADRRSAARSGRDHDDRPAAAGSRGSGRQFLAGPRRRAPECQPGRAGRDGARRRGPRDGRRPRLSAEPVQPGQPRRTASPARCSRSSSI